MTTYRRKSFNVRAVQWDGKSDAIRQQVNGELSTAVYSGLVVMTTDGASIATPGDWIVEGVQGDLHVYPPNVFEATFEPVA